mgnify:CR=1 FL=1
MVGVNGVGKTTTIGKMAKQFNYKSQIEQGEVIQSWHVSQSVDAFSTANQVAYDISVSGSFKSARLRRRALHSVSTASF